MGCAPTRPHHEGAHLVADDVGEKLGKLLAHSEEHTNQLRRVSRKLEQIEDRVGHLERSRERIVSSFKAIGVLGGMVASALAAGKFVWDWIASIPLFKP